MLSRHWNDSVGRMALIELILQDSQTDAKDIVSIGTGCSTAYFDTAINTNLKKTDTV